MYEDTYGMDWSRLSTEAILERSFALGVAAALGEDHPDELERLEAETSSAYLQNMVDLAFDEGWNRASKIKAQNDYGIDELWEEIVVDADIEFLSDDSTESDEEPADDAVSVSRPTGRPQTIVRFTLLEPSGSDERDRLGLPDFLR